MNLFILRAAKIRTFTSLIDRMTDMAISTQLVVLTKNIYVYLIGSIKLRLMRYTLRYKIIIASARV